MSQSTKENQPVEIIILAAGAGTRMQSGKAKVMHKLAGKPMLEHVLTLARAFNPEKIHIVYGHQADQLRAAFNQNDINWVEQAVQMGTGHAVRCVLPHLAPDSKVLVLYGDVPALQNADVMPLVEQCNRKNLLGVLLAEIEDPKGYGRAIIANGQVVKIVEEKLATDTQRLIKHVNTGLICAQSSQLTEWVSKLNRNNAQNEYLLTDIFEIAAAEKTPAFFHVCKSAWRAFGANDAQQLVDLERRAQKDYAQKLMAKGVRLADPGRIDIRGELTTGMDVEIDVNVIFEGHVELANDVKIGPFNRIRNCKLAAGTVVHAHCDLENVISEGACEIGPFARLRPGTVLQQGSKIGNFVECKNAQIGPASKVSHLSYIGDAVLGERVNIGAGTITCNYDGVNKHQTRIGSDVFVGSNSSLVAPLEIGAGATIGAGSVITSDAPDAQLTLSRSPQKTVINWRRPEKVI
jgi:bifunctional UDP-N-acetylglucosamine pyrophosphorylase / glucosamine-1-phosphate N-acetyltransferase